MKKVKMLTSMAGLDFSYLPGEELNVPDDVAQAWHDAKLAEIVEEPAKKPKKAVKHSGNEADHTADTGADHAE